MATVADIETSAMASTPTRPIQKSRMIEMVSATMTGMVAARSGLGLRTDKSWAVKGVILAPRSPQPPPK